MDGSRLLLGLDLNNVINHAMDSCESSHTTRQSMCGRAKVSYNMKSHPMDAYFRPKRAARQGRTESVEKRVRLSIPVEKESKCLVDKETAEQMACSTTPRRRSARNRGATATFSYNQKTHPQDDALALLGIIPKPRRRVPRQALARASKGTKLSILATSQRPPTVLGNKTEIPDSEEELESDSELESEIGEPIEILDAEEKPSEDEPADPADSSEYATVGDDLEPLDRSIPSNQQLPCKKHRSSPDFDIFEDIFEDAEEYLSRPAEGRAPDYQYAFEFPKENLEGMPIEDGDLPGDLSPAQQSIVDWENQDVTKCTGPPTTPDANDKSGETQLAIGTHQGQDNLLLSTATSPLDFTSSLSEDAKLHNTVAAHTPLTPTTSTSAILADGGWSAGQTIESPIPSSIWRTIQDDFADDLERNCMSRVDTLVGAIAQPKP